MNRVILLRMRGRCGAHTRAGRTTTSAGATRVDVKLKRGNSLRTKDLGPIVIAADGAHTRPHFWTIATVGTVHLLLSALLLTSTGPILEPDVLSNVEIVTLPQSNNEPAQTVVPERPNPAAPVPVPVPAQDVTTQAAPVETPPPPNSQIVPEAKKAPAATPQPVNPEADVAPVPVEEAAPIPFTPLAAPSMPKPVTLRPAAPTLTQPTPEALQLKAQQLKNAAVTPLQAPQNLRVPDAVEEEEPYVPGPLPALMPATAPSLRPLPNRPITTTPTQAAPLTLPKTTRALPDVQVPRIRASDLRVPDEHAQATSGNPAQVSGKNAGGQAGNGSTGAVTSLGSPFAGGSGPLNGGAESTAASGPLGPSPGGPSGRLPRRPGGAGVKTEFPTGVGDTVVARMARTTECAQINRLRDGKCPDWDPVEGRNPRLQKPIAVAVPKDAAPSRFPLGTNPLPLCKPGTPQAQFGLSCLPRDDGPGIPKP